MQKKDNSVIDHLQLNRPRGIVPPMKNVVGNTYAETRSEIEARERAIAEMEAAQIAAREAANAPVKKASVWFSVLTIIFLVVALLGTGFGIFEYIQNITLREDYAKLEKDYVELKDSADETKHQYEEMIEEILAELEEAESKIANDSPATEAPTEPEPES